MSRTLADLTHDLGASPRLQFDRLSVGIGIDMVRASTSMVLSFSQGPNLFVYRCSIILLPHYVMTMTKIESVAMVHDAGA